MELIYLVLVFVVMLAILWMRKPLFMAMLAGIVVAVILYRIPIGSFLSLAARSASSWGTIQLILVLYMITYLQRMLEVRGHLMLAQKSLNGIFNSRRVDATLAPILIGMLPSAAAVTICGGIVDAAAGDSLTVEEKTFVSSFFRHIPESILPTYSSIIVACTLSGVPIGSFVLGMAPMVPVLVFLGYFFYLKKIPRESERVRAENRREHINNLIISLWTLFLVIFLIMVFKLPVWIAVGIVLPLCALLNKFSFSELTPLFAKAFEQRMILNMLMIFVFRDVLIHAGVINAMPAFFAKLPAPPFIVFALLFFFGTLVGGANAISATCIPMAFNTIPNAGMPLLVLLLGFSYASMQISPTHVCLSIITEYFKTSMASLIRKTLPCILCYCVVLTGYYLLLVSII